MSTTPKTDSKTTEQSNSISEVDDMKMFQAARRTGRRNAMGDLSEQISQINGSNSASDVDKMTPHFKSMSIKQ